MKKNIYILGLIVGTFAVNAQGPTLTQANNAPASGDIQANKKLDSTALLTKTSGASQTWNYSSSVTTSTNTNISTTTYTTASSIPGASMFTGAGANVAATDSSQFLKSTATSLELVGQMSANGSKMFFTNTMQLMQFPFSYGNSYTDTYAGTFTISVGVVNLNGTIKGNANAYGTVILPSSPSNLSFSNVLRVTTNNTMTIAGTGTLALLTGTSIVTGYTFFKASTKFPFFQMQYTSMNIPAKGSPTNNVSIAYDATLPVSVQEISSSTPAVFVFPNPTNDFLNIQMNKTDYKAIKVMDIQGKIVRELILSSTPMESINIQDLKSGEYILLMINSISGLPDISYKFIKE